MTTPAVSHRQESDSSAGESWENEGGTLIVSSTRLTEDLFAEDRLGILQAADSLHNWYSLDDRRLCAQCQRLINGHQIEIALDSSDHYLLHCPTRGCPSTLDDWFYEDG